MVTHLKFWNWSKSTALLLQVNYNIELEQHGLEKHWSEEFSYPLSEFFFCHCSERDSPSYGSSEQTEESKTTTSYVLLAKQRSVFIPGEKGHSILVAFFLAGVRKGRKKVIVAPFRFLSNARYAGYRTRNIPHSIY